MQDIKMTRSSVLPRDQIFVKSYGFLSFARKIRGNIGKNLSSKYSQELLDYPKQSTTDVFKTTSKRAIQKTAEAIGDLIGNKIVDKITSAPKTSSQNNSEENIQNDSEIHKEKCNYVGEKWKH